MTNRLAGLLCAVVLYLAIAGYMVATQGFSAGTLIGAVIATAFAALILALLMWLVIAPMIRAAGEAGGALGDLARLISRRDS